MSTNGSIGYVELNGKVTSTYNNYDSYIINGLGERLYKTCKTDYDAYGVFLRKNTWIHACKKEFLKHCRECGYDYAYLWENNEWHVASKENNNFYELKPLKHAFVDDYKKTYLNKELKQENIKLRKMKEKMELMKIELTAMISDIDKLILE